MTGMLIVAAAIALLIAALAPAHRRATTTWRPGADLVADRDQQRVTAELTAVAQRRARAAQGAARVRRTTGAAVPLHRSAPRLMSH